MFVRYFGRYEWCNAVYLCLEHMPLGNLTDCFDGLMTEMDALVITQQIFQGINYLHERGCSHRDIDMQVSASTQVPYPAWRALTGDCTQNILVGSRPPGPQGWQVKIADFGMCQFVSKGSYAMWVDIVNALQIFGFLVSVRPAGEIEPTVATHVDFMMVTGDESFLKSGLSELCLKFRDWGNTTEGDRLTSAEALRQPWLQLGDWGCSHYLKPVARKAATVEPSAADVTDGSGYAFVKTDGGAWELGVIAESLTTIRPVPLTDSAAAGAGSRKIARAPEVWETGSPRPVETAGFLAIGRLMPDQRSENASPVIWQSVHPTKPARVLGSGRRVIEFGGPDRPPVGYVPPEDGVLGLGYSPDGARLLVAD